MALIITNPAAYLRISVTLNKENTNIEVGIFPFNSKVDYKENNVVLWLNQVLKINPSMTFPYANETLDILGFAHDKLLTWLTTDETEPIMSDSGEKDADGNPVMVETGTKITRAKICNPEDITIDLIR